MQNKIVLKGMWHLPKNPEFRVAGILTFEPNHKIVLELIGDLRGKNTFADFGESQNEEVIFGEADGKFHTLFNCSYFGTINGSATFALSNYKCQFLVEGCHLDSFEDKDFDYVQVQFEHLGKWVGKYPVTMERTKVRDAFHNTDITINPDLDFFETYTLDDEHKFELVTRSHIQRTFEKLNILTLSFATIFADQKSDLWSLLNRMNTFKSFLSLGCLQKTAYQKVSFGIKPTNFEGRDQLYNLYYIEHDTEAPKPIKRYLFNFETVESRFEEILKNWYSSIDEMFPIAMHLLDSLTNKQTFSSADFLIVAFALEGYHIRYFKKDLGLAESVKHFINMFLVIDEVKALDIDIDAVRVSRNYYTHLFNKKPKALSGIPLLKMTNDLKILLICCVLYQSGFNMDEIKNSIRSYNL